jgi:molybdopterin molybdotransferase
MAGALAVLVVAGSSGAGPIGFFCNYFPLRVNAFRRRLSAHPAMDLPADPVHTPVMHTTQRLPASLTPLDAALTALLAGVKLAAASRPPSPELQGDLSAGLGELKAWPPHDVAAVDGWALRASDLVGASSYTPVPLRRSPVWVEAGDRIPDGCNCVLDEDSLDMTTPMAQAMAEAIPGQGIRRKGEEIADAGRIAEAWRTPGAVDAAHRPVVRVVNCPGGIITAGLVVLGLRAGGVTVLLTEAPARDAASIAPHLDGRDCDLIITIGGSGVGRTDASVIALAERGEVIAHGLALQPGRTAAVGRIGGTPVIVMPGAPDQALAVWWTLVMPVLDRLTGRQRTMLTRPLARKIASSVGLAEIVLLEETGGTWLPLAVGDLPLAAVARASAWLLVPGGSEGHAAGTAIAAYMLRE